MDIAVKIERGNLRIYIDGLLHFSVHGEEVGAMQSWKGSGYWHIMFYTKTIGKIHLEYGRIETWKEILKQINELNFI